MKRNNAHCFRRHLKLINNNNNYYYYSIFSFFHHSIQNRNYHHTVFHSSFLTSQRFIANNNNNNKSSRFKNSKNKKNNNSKNDYFGEMDFEKLLSNHLNYKNNFITLQKDEKILLNFQKICLEVIKNSKMIEKLAFIIDNHEKSNNNNNNESIPLHIFTNKNENNNNNNFQRFSVSKNFIDFLMNPISIPHLSMEDIIIEYYLIHNNNNNNNNNNEIKELKLWHDSVSSENNKNNNNNKFDYFPSFAFSQILFPNNNEKNFHSLLTVLETISFFKWSFEEQKFFNKNNNNNLLEEIKKDLETLKNEMNENNNNKNVSMDSLNKILKIKKNIFQKSFSILDKINKIDHFEMIQENEEGEILEKKDENIEKKVNYYYQISSIDLLFNLLFRYLLMNLPFLNEENNYNHKIENNNNNIIKEDFINYYYNFFTICTFPFFKKDISISMSFWLFYFNLNHHNNNNSENNKITKVKDAYQFLLNPQNNNNFNNNNIFDFRHFLRSFSFPIIIDHNNNKVENILSEIHKKNGFMNFCYFLLSSEKKQKMYYELLFLSLLIHSGFLFPNNNNNNNNNNEKNRKQSLKLLNQYILNFNNNNNDDVSATLLKNEFKKKAKTLFLFLLQNFKFDFYFNEKYSIKKENVTISYFQENKSIFFSNNNNKIYNDDESKKIMETFKNNYEQFLFFNNNNNNYNLELSRMSFSSFYDNIAFFWSLDYFKNKKIISFFEEFLKKSFASFLFQIINENRHEIILFHLKELFSTEKEKFQINFENDLLKLLTQNLEKFSENNENNNNKIVNELFNLGILINFFFFIHFKINNNNNKKEMKKQQTEINLLFLKNIHFILSENKNNKEILLSLWPTIIKNENNNNNFEKWKNNFNLICFTDEHKKEIKNFSYQTENTNNKIINEKTEKKVSQNFIRKNLNDKIFKKWFFHYIHFENNDNNNNLSELEVDSIYKDLCLTIRKRKNNVNNNNNNSENNNNNNLFNTMELAVIVRTLSLLYFLKLKHHQNKNENFSILLQNYLITLREKSNHNHKNNNFREKIESNLNVIQKTLMDNFLCLVEKENNHKNYYFSILSDLIYLNYISFSEMETILKILNHNNNNSLKPFEDILFSENNNQNYFYFCILEKNFSHFYNCNKNNEIQNYFENSILSILENVKISDNNNNNNLFSEILFIKENYYKSVSNTIMKLLQIINNNNKKNNLISEKLKIKEKNEFLNRLFFLLLFSTTEAEKLLLQRIKNNIENNKNKNNHYLNSYSNFCSRSFYNISIFSLFYNNNINEKEIKNISPDEKSINHFLEKSFQENNINNQNHKIILSLSENNENTEFFLQNLNNNNNYYIEKYNKNENLNEIFSQWRNEILKKIFPYSALFLNNNNNHQNLEKIKNNFLFFMKSVLALEYLNSPFIIVEWHSIPFSSTLKNLVSFQNNNNNNKTSKINSDLFSVLSIYNQFGAFISHFENNNNNKNKNNHYFFFESCLSNVDHQIFYYIKRILYDCDENEFEIILKFLYYVSENKNDNHHFSKQEKKALPENLSQQEKIIKEAEKLLNNNNNNEILLQELKNYNNPQNSLFVIAPSFYCTKNVHYLIRSCYDTAGKYYLEYFHNFENKNNEIPLLLLEIGAHLSLQDSILFENIFSHFLFYHLQNKNNNLNFYDWNRIFSLFENFSRNPLWTNKNNISSILKDVLLEFLEFYINNENKNENFIKNLGTDENNLNLFQNNNNIKDCFIQFCLFLENLHFLFIEDKIFWLKVKLFTEIFIEEINKNNNNNNYEKNIRESFNFTVSMSGYGYLKFSE